MLNNHTGFVRIYRSILDNPTFRNAEEAMFFAYMVLKANWREGERRYDERVYQLERGEFVIGERKLAEDFGWTRKKVRGVVRRLEQENMIMRKWAQHGAQRAPVITVCNYEIYQAAETARDQGRDQDGPKVGPPKNEGNEGKEDNQLTNYDDDRKNSSPNTGKSYAFKGTTFHLTESHFGRLEKLCSDIPDLMPELVALDNYYADNPDKVPQSQWFKTAIYSRLQNSLIKKHQEWRHRKLEESRAEEPRYNDGVY